MKKFDTLKTVQLFVFIAMTIVCILLLVTGDSAASLAISSPRVRKVFFAMFFLLILSFFFIFLDFSMIANYRKEYNALSVALHSDNLTGIANRYSCDILIEQYLEKELPEDIACMMFDLSNIRSINEEFGHLAGNQLIRDFSSILKNSALGLCFVGRNGGNKFLAIFEHTDGSQIDLFLERIEEKTTAYNDNNKMSIEYKYGTAIQNKDSSDSITSLISLSNDRIYR